MFNCSDYLDKPYGVCSHISRYDWEWKYCKKNLDLCNDVGIEFIRTDFDQSTWENSNRGIFSDVFSNARRENINVLPILTNNLYGGHKYDSYVSEIIKKYGFATQYFEVMNEPDLINKDISQNAKLYCERLKSINSVAKRVNPNNLIVFGGVASVYSGFLEECFKQKTDKYYDVINFHNYSSPEDVVQNCKYLRSKMDLYGVNKPVWITETGVSTIKKKDFYSDFLPYAFKRLNILPEKSVICVVYGADLYDLLDYTDDIFSNFKAVRYIHVDDLSTENLKDINVLVPSFNEYFPRKGKEAILSFVKKGGTIICPKGSPFYYEAFKDGKFYQSNGEFVERLHMGIMYSWTDEAKEKEAHNRPTQYISKGKFLFPDKIAMEDGRYLTNKNLHNGDKYISLVDAFNGKYKGSVAGYYKLNSDLKGNIIVCTLRNYEMSKSDYLQAKWLVRTYLLAFSCGVEKVFYYRMRASEKKYDKEEYFGLIHENFERKSSYDAYKVLVSMCPSGSTRPILETKNGIYKVCWQKKNGNNICAYWTLNNPQWMKIKPYNKAFDLFGKECIQRNGCVYLQSSPIYIVS